MAVEINRDPDLEWLDLVNPVGLVIASRVIKDLGLTPIRQTSIDTKLVENLINLNENESVLTDAWQFMEQVLGWNSEYVAGAPNTPPPLKPATSYSNNPTSIPDELKISLPEHGTVLSPDWVVKMGTEENPWQLLVKQYEHGVKPDDRAQTGGWEATPHQRFERLLRDSGVFAGLMILSNEFRLVYAPKGETSGYISFPIRPLATVAGRPILAGLKLLLDENRLFLESEERRLPAILKASREAQVEVSTKLADQVLGALHELLRGFHTAAPEMTVKLAKTEPERLYDGLLTILMRLVFILYAEDRELLPSRSDMRAREIYELSYSLRGLFARLVEDESLNPDTMDERHGAWGQLLVLFRMIHGGYPIESDKAQQFVISRGGKLFNPNEFLFIEGRNYESDEPQILNITDGCILRILTDLMTLQRKGQDRERLSYRTLDVEQIGSVYETIMGFTVTLANDQMVAIKAGKNNKTPVFVGLNKILEETASKARTKYIKDHTDKALSSQISDQIEKASTLSELKSVLDNIIDERGSPNQSIVSEDTPILQPTDERRGTGSHYTPRVLTESVVKHALEPVFDQLGEKPRPNEILELKICDPAMGSGAFLVEACRALGRKLIQAWKDYPDEKEKGRTEEDEEIFARRLVVSRCIYGVDRNPRAVDLAKLSLWLATLARDEEFTFVDHALKCGDSLVGLTINQLESASWDTKSDTKSVYADKIVNRIEKVYKIREVIRSSADSIPVSELEIKNNEINSEISVLRNLGDAVIATFFNFDKLQDRNTELNRIELLVYSEIPRLDKLNEHARSFHSIKFGFHPFHWEIEFPEVFGTEKWGFDVIIGNPPFAGTKTIKKNNLNNYIPWLQLCHENSHGKADLVAHFFRKSFFLLKNDGIAGLIATTTISEGDTRTSGLAQMLNQNCSIIRAQTRVKWPGEASILVSIVHFMKGQFEAPVLNNSVVKRISANLVDSELDFTPKPINSGEKKSFSGTFVLGNGFLFDDKWAEKGECENLETMSNLISTNPNNKKVIFPYITGDEINSSPSHQTHRHVINFYDRPLSRNLDGSSWFSLSEQQKKEALNVGIVPADYPDEVAEDWPELVEILRKRVKPFREKKSEEYLRRRWWQFKRITPNLVKAIENLDFVFAATLKSKYWTVARVPNRYVYSVNLVVFAFQNFPPFTILQSRIHELWARYFSATLGLAIAYAPSDCFDTFPFPVSFEDSPELNQVGEKYHEFRANLMVDLDIGLTKIYNRFHDQNDNDSRIIKLREMHNELDRSVLKSYGWDDLIDKAIPEFIDKNSEEGKQIVAWYDWPQETKNEVFTRLLELNHELTKSQKSNKNTSTLEDFLE